MDRLLQMLVRLVLAHAVLDFASVIAEDPCMNDNGFPHWVQACYQLIMPLTRSYVAGFDCSQPWAPFKCPMTCGACEQVHGDAVCDESEVRTNKQRLSDALRELRVCDDCEAPPPGMATVYVVKEATRLVQMNTSGYTTLHPNDPCRLPGVNCDRCGAARELFVGSPEVVDLPDAAIGPGFMQLHRLEVAILQKNEPVATNASYIPGEAWASFQNLSHWLMSRFARGDIPEVSGLQQLSGSRLVENEFYGDVNNLFGSPEMKYLSCEQLTNLGKGWTQPGPLVESRVCAMKKIQFFDLSFMELTGTLPSCLRDFKSLTHVYTMDNHFHGQVDMLLQSPHLEVIWINQNNFSGTLPTALSSATNLLRMKLHDNRLSGTLPSLSSPRLIEVNAQNNMFVSAGSIHGSGVLKLLFNSNSFQRLPTAWWNLSGVRELDLSNNKIQSWPPAGVYVRGSLLESGYLGSCGFPPLAEAFHWPDMVKVGISANPLHQDVREVLGSFATLPKLEALDVSKCGLVNDVPAEGGFGMLVQADIRNCDVTQMSSGFPVLRSLNAQNNSIQALGGLPWYALQSADFSWNALDFVHISWMQAGSALFLQDFRGNPELRFPVLPPVDGATPCAQEATDAKTVLKADARAFSPGLSKDISKECTEPCIVGRVIYLDGSANATSLCRCRAGWYGDGGNCTECGPNEWSGTGMLKPIACPLHSTTAGSGARGSRQSSQEVCLCDAGYYRYYSPNLSLSCEPCPENHFTLDGGAASLAACIKCPKGRFSAAGSHKCSECVFPEVADEVQGVGCTSCPAGRFVQAYSHDYEGKGPSTGNNDTDDHEDDHEDEEDHDEDGHEDDDEHEDDDHGDEHEEDEDHEEGGEDDEHEDGHGDDEHENEDEHEDDEHEDGDEQEGEGQHEESETDGDQEEGHGSDDDGHGHAEEEEEDDDHEGDGEGDGHGDGEDGDGHGHGHEGEGEEQKGHAHCELCAVGQYQGLAGQEACIPCEGEGNLTWDAGEALIQLKGAIGPESCGCAPGRRPVGRDCVPCGSDANEGLVCSGGLGDHTVSLEKGYYSTVPISIYKCWGDEDRCPGGVIIPGKEPCAEGRTGLTCGECKDGKIPGSKGTCRECRGGNTAFVPVVVAVMIGIAVTLYLYVDSSTSYLQRDMVLLAAAVVSIAVTAMQQAGVMSLLSIEWVEPLYTALGLLRLLTFDLEMLQMGCIAQVTPLRVYVIKVLVILVCIVVMLLIHVGVVLIRHKGDFAARKSTLVACVGTVTTVFYITVVASIVGPLQCQPHPNGKWTARVYPSIVCWESQVHTTMVLVCAAASTMPIGYLATLLYTVRQYPRRVQNGDMAFLRAYSFLFYRFRPETYWYIVVQTLRSFVLAITNIIPTPVFAVFVMQTVMMLSAFVTVRVLPWRAPDANQLDFISSIVILMMLSASFAFMSNIDSSSKRVIAWGCVCSLALGIFLPPLMLLFSFIARLASQKKQFMYFLCHHKAGAGAFARLLKIMLLETLPASSQVFIDCDNLDNLDSLFSYVREDTEVLVAIASRELLLRPWCVGEITTARMSGVKVMPVRMPDFVFPEKDVIEEFETVVEMAPLVERGISVAMVKEMLNWLQKQQTIELPFKPALMTVEDLIKALLRKRVSNTISLQPSALRSRSTDTVIIVDHANLEAVASAWVLEKMVTPVVAQEQGSRPCTLSQDMQIDASATRGVFILSGGCLESQSFASKLMSAAGLQLGGIPVVAQETFRFPSKEETSQLPLLAGMDPAVNYLTKLFKEIAVTFLVQFAGDDVLRLACRSIANRMLKLKRSPLVESSSSYTARKKRATAHSSQYNKHKGLNTSDFEKPSGESIVALMLSSPEYSGHLPASESDGATTKTTDWHAFAHEMELPWSRSSTPSSCSSEEGGDCSYI